MLSNSHAVFYDAIMKNHAIALSSSFIIQTAVRENQDKLALLPLRTRIDIDHILIKKTHLSAVGLIFHQFFLSHLDQFKITPVRYNPI